MSGNFWQKKNNNRENTFFLKELRIYYKGVLDVTLSP